MDLSGSDWLIVILLLIGVAVLLIGLLGKMRFNVVLVGGLLTAIAVILLVLEVTQDEAVEPAASPTPAPSVEAQATSSPGPSPSGRP